jgi:hypothetical protein
MYVTSKSRDRKLAGDGGSSLLSSKRLTEAGAHLVLMEMPTMLCMKPRERGGGWGG